MWKNIVYKLYIVYSKWHSVSKLPTMPHQCIK